ncbi:hypothetical protein [Peribacillus frigoritolerans]|uniref:hypothetical protein n=1 Tax=Peribacillus frigoritolerans TaxID=450367 RepID=UPI00315D8872
MFRTICRQIYSLEHGMKNYTEMANNYNDIKKDYLRDKLIEKGVESNIETHVQTLLDLSIDLRVNVTNSMIQNAKEALDQAKSLYEKIIIDIDKNQSNRIYNYSVKLNKAYPVALSGFGNLYTKKGSTIDFVPVVLNIIPS